VLPDALTVSTRSGATAPASEPQSKSEIAFPAPCSSYARGGPPRRVWLSPIPPVWRNFFIPFVVALVVLLDHGSLDETVQYLKTYARPHRQRPAGMNGGGCGIRTILYPPTRHVPRCLRDSAARLARRPLLDPSALPPPKQSGRQGEVRCLVMPFSPRLVDEFHRILVGACNAAGPWQRGDDLFTPPTSSTTFGRLSTS
jgi:hypothetical protein